MVMKRVVDIVASLGGLVLLSPLFLIVAVTIKIDSRGPVLYKQVRAGDSAGIVEQHTTVGRLDHGAAAVADSEKRDPQLVSGRAQRPAREADRQPPQSGETDPARPPPQLGKDQTAEEHGV